MYTRCLFCHADLGRNESVEEFPIGRRLAFDAAKGRLWVVCRGCERWNLTPLEERWEAIEQCERLFRDTRLRVSTDNIGMARLREGLELVRIGKPQRPEFAAWRYGDQFGRRRRRQLLAAGASTAVVGALMVGSALATSGLFVFVNFWSAARNAIFGDPDAVVLRVPRASDTPITLSRRDLADVAIRPSSKVAGGWRLRIPWELPYESGVLDLTGDEALRTLGVILPHLNRYGGSRAAVASAVRVLEDAGGPEPYVTETVAALARRPRQPGMTPVGGTHVTKLAGPVRLALEMALHEEQERRALEGELAALAVRWKEAEEIAAIADDLFLPGSVTAALDRLKRGVSRD
ncbi:MAG: hypothetical protein ACJ8AO_02480 [Gemmatimonadaceae bacterium]